MQSDSFLLEVLLEVVLGMTSDSVVAIVAPWQQLMLTITVQPATTAKTNNY